MEVYLDNKVQLLIDVVNERRKVEPSCKVAYHDMGMDNDDMPGSFTLTLKHRIYFVPLAQTEDDEQGRLNQMSVGASVPRSTWENSKLCSIKWAAKWAVNGLTPVRPLVVTNNELSLGAGRAIAI